MNIDITDQVLPGIGVCQEIDLRDGHRIGVVSWRNGLRDLISYDEEGEGAAAAVLCRRT
jgi:TrkA domain protein